MYNWGTVMELTLLTLLHRSENVLLLLDLLHLLSRLSLIRLVQSWLCLLESLFGLFSCLLRANCRSHCRVATGRVVGDRRRWSLL